MEPSRGPRVFTTYLPTRYVETTFVLPSFIYLSSIKDNTDRLSYVWSSLEKDLFGELLKYQQNNPTHLYGPVEHIEPSEEEKKKVTQGFPLEISRIEMFYRARVTAYRPVQIDADKYDVAILVSALTRLKSILRDKDTDEDVLKTFKAGLRGDILHLFGEAARAVFEA